MGVMMRRIRWIHRYFRSRMVDVVNRYTIGRLPQTLDSYMRLSRVPMPMLITLKTAATNMVIGDKTFPNLRCCFNSDEG